MMLTLANMMMRLTILMMMMMKMAVMMMIAVSMIVVMAMMMVVTSAIMFMVLAMVMVLVTLMMTMGMMTATVSAKLLRLELHDLRQWRASALPRQSQSQSRFFRMPVAGLPRWTGPRRLVSCGGTPPPPRQRGVARLRFYFWNKRYVYACLQHRRVSEVVRFFVAPAPIADPVGATRTSCLLALDLENGFFVVPTWRVQKWGRNAVMQLCVTAERSQN